MVINIPYGGMLENSKHKIQKSKIGSDKQEITKRLHRVKGQIEGVEDMIGQGKECYLVIHQIMAARSALGAVAVKLLTEASCAASNRKDQTKLEQLLNQLLKFH